MKLLLFSDLHTDVSAATRLVELAHAADVVVPSIAPRLPSQHWGQCRHRQDRPGRLTMHF
jgi:hypothetical protein